MNQIIYECLKSECGCKFKANDKDGLRCPKCASPIVPFKLEPTRTELLEVPTYKELKVPPMVIKRSWQDFRNSGLLWWINMILHTFGWSIITDIESDGTIKNVYPARVKYRGFTGELNTEGYIKVSKYLNKESVNLLKESRE